jgi:hypothetical protein
VRIVLTRDVSVCAMVTSPVVNRSWNQRSAGAFLVGAMVVKLTHHPRAAGTGPAWDDPRAESHAV